MEPMKMNTLLSSSSEKRNSSGSPSNNIGQCEVRPGGMLVQKRSSDSNNPASLSSIPTIRVRVKYVSSYHDVLIGSQASFGELKKKLAEATGLHPQEQKLIFKDKERDSKAFLDIARVKDGSKIVLVEDVASKERRCLEMRRNAKVENKTMKSLSEINSEVDKLQGQVKGLESIVSRGGRVPEIDIDNLIESLMSRLIQLDGIVAEGDLKMKRRMEVRRVQKYIETLDVLKLQISKPGTSMEAKIHDHRRRERLTGVGDKPRLLQKAINQGNYSAQNPVIQRPLVKQSEPVVVTTKWETFD